MFVFNVVASIGSDETVHCFVTHHNLHPVHQIQTGRLDLSDLIKIYIQADISSDLN